MKGSKSTCLLCRHLAANSGGATSQTTKWQTQASRFYTNNATLRSDDPSNASPTPTSNASNAPPPTEAAETQPQLGKVRRVVQGNQKTILNTNWSPVKIKKIPVNNNSARVDALFQQIVRQQTTNKYGPTGTQQTSPNMDLALVQAIGKLELMIGNGKPVADAYAYLITQIYPLLQEPHITIPKVFYTVVSKLLDRVVAAKKKSIRSPDLPAVSDIFRVYTDIGEMKPQRWAALVADLVRTIIEIDPSAEEEDSAIARADLLARDDLLNDLVESWKVLSLPQSVPVMHGNELMDGFWFPKIDNFALRKFSGRGDFPAALSSIFPQYHPNLLGTPVAILAIATYALLLDPERSNLEARRNAARFVSKIAYLITFVNFQDAGLLEGISHTFPELKTYIMYRWPDIKQQLKLKLETIASDGNVEPNRSPHPTKAGSINISRVGYRLKRAFLTRNIHEVNGTWLEFIGHGNRITLERASEMREYPDIFNQFIHARMALDQPDEAVNALNTMREVGLRPTMKTWNSMLTGCRKARNAVALNAVWAKLVSSGVKLDTKIWTTRISGLIECGDAEAGIRALQEMSRLWDESSKDEHSTAVEPTIEPVNAALLGLVRTDQVSAAESLLQWADRQGIKPDVFTYNTLLRRSVRDGRDEDVQRLFAAMQEANVAADEATFTIILDGAFTRIDPDAVEEQARVVSDMLDHMHEIGLEPNLQTYAKIIYNLLQGGDRATKPIKSVLAHLWSHGLELSPHIYTMLVEHYFSCGPPDVESVDALLQRRTALNYDSVEDNILYDRIIKGYALAGQPLKALDYYYKLSQIGVPVILPTQVELLRALLRDGHVQAAREMAANTKTMFEESNRAKDEVESAKFWGHRFWYIVFSNGLLEGRDAMEPWARRASSHWAGDYV
ncbi:uncharacterized protein F4812DRAFT_46209 [Daldinia caldariorum]|uniref:uncharacterized protein n=1 Tax=Daldinia caldariorum TaxID=326644 RepID=UPI002007878F|nr:uncharacterized protein F4812DRAFT_46209 [Daldinia caldariorum]KAI1467030.1 hypothetical protein F4812DRAFT_46209 [Daldinia caldariorum]